MLTQHLVGIELLGPGQGFSFGNGLTEAIPGKNRRDRVKGVPFGLACRYQGSANTCIQANLLVDGTAISLKGSHMLALGLAEHRSDQAVEQVDRMVSQPRCQVESDPRLRPICASPACP